MDAGAPPDNETLSKAEAAAYLGVSERTVLRWLHKGELIAHEVHTIHGPAWRFPRHLLPAPRAPRAKSGDAPPATALPAPVDATVATTYDSALTVAPLDATHAGVQDTDRDLAKYLLSRVLDLERENRELRERLSQGAPPARIPWWRRILRKHTP